MSDTYDKCTKCGDIFFPTVASHPLCHDCIAAELERLRGVVAEALEFADEGWSYASDYFKKKWDYEGERHRLSEAAEKGGGS